ncbi:hypothetical protein ASF21_02015 [Arthrobacter sp. Leaf234]|nr:hypothetical protein ASF21_02015 [Arthrobacter sp. Leaf234]
MGHPLLVRSSRIGHRSAVGIAPAQTVRVLMTRHRRWHPSVHAHKASIRPPIRGITCYADGTTT